jgi:cell fate (sporulation/competence/biofilm development) regulator YlbF (YheA/YmcA/DUF963 family)
MMNETNTLTLTRDLQEATDNLAENLLRAEPILAFRRAKSRLDTDGEASGLLGRLSAAQTGLRALQARNDVSQADLERVRSLQRAVQADTTIMGFAEAQKTATDYLTEINQEISRMLGFDFAALASPGCCG